MLRHVEVQPLVLSDPRLWLARFVARQLRGVDAGHGVRRPHTRWVVQVGLAALEVLLQPVPRLPDAQRHGSAPEARHVLARLLVHGRGGHGARRGATQQATGRREARRRARRARAERAAARLKSELVS